MAVDQVVLRRKQRPDDEDDADEHQYSKSYEV